MHEMLLPRTHNKLHNAERLQCVPTVVVQNTHGKTAPQTPQNASIAKKRTELYLINVPKENISKTAIVNRKIIQETTARCLNPTIATTQQPKYLDGLIKKHQLHWPALSTHTSTLCLLMRHKILN